MLLADATSSGASAMLPDDATPSGASATLPDDATPSGASATFPDDATPSGASATLPGDASSGTFLQFSNSLCEANSFMFAHNEVLTRTHNNLHIKYTLFIDGFSYIFDSVFNRPDVVFSLIMLNTTFLDSVNWISPKAYRSLSFHCSVVMVSGFTPNRGS